MKYYNKSKLKNSNPQSVKAKILEGIEFPLLDFDSGTTSNKRAIFENRTKLIGYITKSEHNGTIASSLDGKINAMAYTMSQAVQILWMALRIRDLEDAIDEDYRR